MFTIIIFLVLISVPTVSASDLDLDLNLDYQDLLNSWEQNIVMARQYLDKAEESLRDGDTLQACVDQRKASKYGLVATKSKIEAEKLIGNTEQVKLLNKGLIKWKAFSEFCG